MADLHSINDAINKRFGRNLITSIIISVLLLVVVFGSVYFVQGLFGFLVWIFIALLVNNLIHKYWKSWGWNFHGFIPQQEPVRFMSDDEASKIAPTMDKK